MGKAYLLDTNTVIDFIGDKLPPHAKTNLSKIVDKEINLSVINKIELLGFSNVDPELVEFVKYANIYPLDDMVVDITIVMRRQLKIKLADAIIAATALANDLTLITSNIDDFKSISNLKVVNPHKL